MEGFAELREDWLRKWLKLPNGTPCYDTFSRVFQAIEPAAFAACIAEQPEQIPTAPPPAHPGFACLLAP